MSRDQTTYRFLLDLFVRNEWRNISLLRTSVKSCFQAVFVDSSDRDSLAMVASELVENAIKYGAWSEREPNLVRLHVRGDDVVTEITVESPVVPSSDGVKSLMSTLAWLDSHDSPEQAYLARLSEIAQAAEQGSGVLESSRLGLVRIAYEGNCRLVAEVSEEGVLSVTAMLQRGQS